MNIVDVPLKLVDHENFVAPGFGRIVTDFDKAQVDIIQWPQTGKRPVVKGTGMGGGVTEGTFEMRWIGDMLHAHNHAVDGKYITGWSCLPELASEDSGSSSREFVYTHEANYHPDGGQIFFSKNNEPFVALLALPKEDVKPEDFVAFYCSGEFGIHLNASVWHQPVFPLNNVVDFDDKQGAVHACVEVHFIKEFDCLLKVPLVDPRTLPGTSAS